MKHEDEGYHNQPKDSENKKGKSQEFVIPVIEESVQIDKKWVETGNVHIFKDVSEYNELINIPLKHEKLHIERVEVNKIVDTLPDAVRYEGETMIISVLKEVVVKKIMIVEEIRLTKKGGQSNFQQEVTLKKEEIHVKRTSPNKDQNK
jgi:uncharacterized protein (TIGR02271 family)